MLPSGQRLEAAQLAGFQVDDRLIYQEQLVVLESLVQIGFEPRHFTSLIMHFRVENLVISAAAFLRLVHSDVGIAQYLAWRGVLIAAEDNSDAHLEEQRALF